MATLVFKGFAGEVPRLSPKDLANNQAVYAKNCKLYSGKIMPFRDYVDTLSLESLTSPPLTIYKFGSYWLHWSSDVNIVESPLADVDERTYVSGMDVPRVFDSTMVLNHTNASTDLISYRVGVPRPDKALIVEREMVYEIDKSTSRGGIGMSAIGTKAICLGGTALESIEKETDSFQSVAYVYTNVNSWGEEGAESPPSRIIDHWMGIDKTESLNPTTGLWTATITGTDEWVYSGSLDVLPSIPSSVSVKGAVYSRGGTIGELGTGEWAWTGSSVVLRLATTDPDPNNLDDDDIEAGWQRYIDVSGFVSTYENDAEESIALSAEHHITKRRIYRVNTGSSSAAYQFVAEIDVADITYRDVILSEDLGEVLATSTHLPPPEDLIGLIALPGGGMAGFRSGDNSNELCLCVPYKCYAWPSGYRVTVNSSIVAIGVVGNTIVIGTDQETLLYTGLDPSSMAFDDNSIKKPCLSKRGMVVTEEGAFFPTVNGLLSVGPGGARVATKEIMRSREWRLRRPETMVSFFLNQNYIAFHDYDFDIDFLENQNLKRQENVEYYYSDRVISGFIGGRAIGMGGIGASKIKPVYVDILKEGGEGFIVGNGISDGTLIRLDYAYAGYVNKDEGYLYVVHKDVNLNEALQAAYDANRSAIIAANEALMDSDEALGGSVDASGIGDVAVNDDRMQDVPPELVLLDNYIIRKLDGHETQNMLCTWTSKVHELPGLLNFGAAKVVAIYGDPVSTARRAAYNAYRDAIIAANEALMDSDEGVGGSVDAFDMNDVAVNDDKLQDVPVEMVDDPTLLFRLFVEEHGGSVLKLKYQRMVTANTPFRLPGKYRGMKVQVSIVSDIEVEEVRLSTSMEELVQVGG